MTTTRMTWCILSLNCIEGIVDSRVENCDWKKVLRNLFSLPLKWWLKFKLHQNHFVIVFMKWKKNHYFLRTIKTSVIYRNRIFFIYWKPESIKLKTTIIRQENSFFFALWWDNNECYLSMLKTVFVFKVSVESGGFQNWN